MSARTPALEFTLSSVDFSDRIPGITEEAVAAHPETGGSVTFDGRVRNHHRGRTVRSLSYSSYEPLARNEGKAILEEAVARFELTFVRAIHRTGDLNIGDIAVWILAGAAHRDAAFDGCRYVIEEVKQRVPIWKHEFYADGTDEWVYAGM